MAEKSATRDAAKPSKPATPNDDVAGLVDVADKSTRGHPLARGFLLGLGVAAAMAIFIVQNTGSIGFEWLWFDFEAHIWVVLLVAFTAGLLAGPLLLAGRRRAARRQAQRQSVVARFKQRGNAESHKGSPSAT